MNRRSFLKIAGWAAALGNQAAARTLVLLSVRKPAAISRIEWFVYETGLRGPGDEPDRRCAVRITAKGGVQGWADVPIGAMPDAATARAIRDRLLGREIEWPSAIWREFYESGLPLGTLAAVDLALWDLLGRVEDKPVHALLGTQRQSIKAYVTSPSNLGEPAQYAEYALACKESGVHGCKVHPYFEPGTGSHGGPGIGFPDRDMAVYEAVRTAVGPDFACMADNRGTYTFDEALRVGRLLDDLKFEWYESPMPETDDWRERYIALAAELKTPICAPETHPDSYPTRVVWLASRACDISRIGAHLGGLTPCIELAVACESHGARLELNDLGLDAYAHLQLIAATSEATIRYIEISTLARATHTHPGRATPEPAFNEQGYVSIPQTPGLGLELDWRHIHTHRVN